MRRRGWAAVLASILVVVSLAGRPAGLCFMTGPGSASDDAHRCCRTGMGAADPSCCMSGERSLPALLPAKAVLSLDVPVDAVLAGAPVTLAEAPRESRGHARDHAPPAPQVLRI